MKMRGQFMMAFCASVIASPLAAEAQPTAKLHSVGIVGDARAYPALFGALERGLRENGYTDGKNIRFEFRSPQGQGERLPMLAVELVKLQVDVIFVAGDQGIRAVMDATHTVPIVMVGCDAVAAGIVANLRQPNGNVTGVSCNSSQLAGKRLQFLREIRSELSSVAVLYNQDDPGKRVEWRVTETAAKKLGLTTQPFGARDVAGLDDAFAAMSRQGISALIVLGDAFTMFHRKRIAEQAARHRLPAAYAYPEFADAGGLLTYGPNLTDMFHKAGVYLSKVLKGAKPAELPVEEPTRFELVVNLKTANGLGLTIPKELLLRADRVIE
jgi:putative ABC transport system substrate-binding protein